MKHKSDERLYSDFCLKEKMIVNILETGAVSDGSLQTGKIQHAIDRCAETGGGTVIIPPGTFVSGRLNLKSGITLKLEAGAVLAGSTDWHDYRLYSDDVGHWRDYGVCGELPGDNPHALELYDTSFLRGTDLHDVGIEGPGVIDGRDCLNPDGEEGFRGPHACCFLRCRNLRLQGYTIRNAANFAHNVNDCENLHLNGVLIESGHDGIHMRRCHDVLIENCFFQIGDDCVAGTDNRNVIVRDCDFNTSCNGLRFAGADLLVSHCYFHGPGRFPHRVSGRHNMLAVITYFAPEGRCPKLKSENWTFRDCCVENVETLISYDGRGGHPWMSAQPLADVTFCRLEISGLRHGSWILGNKLCPPKLEFNHVGIAFASDVNAEPFLYLANLERCKIRDVVVIGYGAKPFIVTDDPVKIDSDNLNQLIVRETFDEKKPSYY